MNASSNRAAECEWCKTWTPTAENPCAHCGRSTPNRVYEWEYRNLDGECVYVERTETMEPPDKSGWYLRMPQRESATRLPIAGSTLRNSWHGSAKQRTSWN